MENPTQKKTILWIVAIAIALVIIVVTALARYRGAPQEQGIQANDSVSTTTMQDEVSMSVATTTVPDLTFALLMDKTTYRAGDTIPFTLVIANTTKAPITLNFKDGCQAAYEIAGWKMIDHIVCTQATTSITIAPNSTKSAKIVHYPSVFRIPPGTYTLSAYAIGYGGAKRQVTITN